MYVIPRRRGNPCSCVKAAFGFHEHFIERFLDHGGGDAFALGFKFLASGVVFAGAFCNLTTAFCSGAKLRKGTSDLGSGSTKGCVDRRRPGAPCRE